MQNPKKKKPKLRYILFGILGVFLFLVCYLFLHDPGIPVNTWRPDDQFSVQDYQRTVIDPAVLLSLDIAPYKNPETVQVRDGWVYAAVEGGSIIRIREDGTNLEQVLHTGGAILGFDLDTQSNLYFCDCSYQGTPAICRYDGQEIHPLIIPNLTYPDALCLDETNGLLYFSNATHVSPVAYCCNPQEAYTIDMMAHTNTGSIECFDLNTWELRTVADGFCFANGIQLTKDGQYLLVNETSENHVWRIDLTSGEKTVLLTVPGYPDNLHAAGDGFWSGLARLYAPAYANLANKSLLRKAITNLPVSILSSISGSAGGKDMAFIKYDAEGTVLAYNIVEGIGFTTTGAVETETRIYLETLGNVSKIYYYEK